MNLAEIIRLLNCREEEERQLFAEAVRLRDSHISNNVHLRGLIEISNICRKDCLYCGIRKSNTAVERYTLSDKEILETARFADEYHYGSIVLQGGERTDTAFVQRIGKLLSEIKKRSQNRLGITLSLGEQTEDTYRYWFENGAHRYLLRIETSDQQLYRKLHPHNTLHAFDTRRACIESLKRCGYQTGSGIMIGLPFQTTEMLARDLLFLKSLDIDMVGMGPYLEHPETPLYALREQLVSPPERLRLGLRMVACLRLLMPDINIAATTALQAIDPLGREKALAAGANVLMPNITPALQRKNYTLYQNKPFSEEGAEEIMQKLVESVSRYGCRIAFREWGDSCHWQKKHASD